MDRAETKEAIDTIYEMVEWCGSPCNHKCPMLDLVMEDCKLIAVMRKMMQEANYDPETGKALLGEQL